ncbi:MAG: selenide, water dikinase SelD [Bryobacterales bacterium]|nr:selenide, water dikinase SelD [Bryobacterales bacterium]
MPKLSAWRSEDVLVGFETSDDAGVFKLTEDCALIQTTDFFTPIVDDPYTYGAIAAANALSDVYAMGGRPATALSIVGFPSKGDAELLLRILQGGADKMREAACSVVGGHSVSDDDIKFGYAVTGVVHPRRFWRNVGARPGDILLLSKPLGTGVIATALKRGVADSAHVDASIAGMLTLNRAAAEALESLEVHACTDITGFGLLGHAFEMAKGAGGDDVSLRIESARVPLLPGALAYSRERTHAGGLNNNRAFAECAVTMEGEVEPALEALLYDPQTSGGLFVALSEADADVALSRFAGFARIGAVTAREGTVLHVR